MPLGACSCQGQPETEAVGKPEGLPLGWPVAGELLEGQTDLAVEAAAHSRNLQTGQKDRHRSHPQPSHQEPPWDSPQEDLESHAGPPKAMTNMQTGHSRAAGSCAGLGAACSGAG